MKKNKTNALRLLDQAKIHYEVQEYEYDEDHLSGEHVLQQVGLYKEEVYKTLVLKGNQDYLVCCIPVLDEIDLKKLAKVSHHKSVEMVHQKDLLGLTGYMRGGCSPIGMKKKLMTYIQEDVQQQDKVAVSAGKRGLQVILAPLDLVKVTHAICVDVIRSTDE